MSESTQTNYQMACNRFDMLLELYTPASERNYASYYSFHTAKLNSLVQENIPLNSQNNDFEKLEDAVYEFMRTYLSDWRFIDTESSVFRNHLSTLYLDDCITSLRQKITLRLEEAKRLEQMYACLFKYIVKFLEDEQETSEVFVFPKDTPYTSHPFIYSIVDEAISLIHKMEIELKKEGQESIAYIFDPSFQPQFATDVQQKNEFEYLNIFIASKIFSLQRKESLPFFPTTTKEEIEPKILFALQAVRGYILDKNRANVPFNEVFAILNNLMYITAYHITKNEINNMRCRYNHFLKLKDQSI